ncbi:MAG: IclR family transcriptional regulator [Anaerolineaceae bacterium]|nr:IclR family transcriptional regulator [Anaerolineaceae bacterium]
MSEDAPQKKHPLINNSLLNGLRLLESYSPERKSWGIREWARELKMDPSSVSRLALTLRANGYLEKDPATKRYSLGPKALRIAELYRDFNPLTTIAYKIFESYLDKFEYNFCFATLEEFNYEVIYLTVLDGRGPVRVISLPGEIVPLHASALGKAILAYQSPAYINDFFQNNKPLGRYTQNTVVEEERLREQLAVIRINKYARNCGELHEDVGAIGMPIFDSKGKVRYAVCLSYPLFRVKEDRIPEIISTTCEMAEKMQERFAF